MPSKPQRPKVVGRPTSEYTHRTRHLGADPTGSPRYGRLNGRLGRDMAQTKGPEYTTPRTSTESHGKHTYLSPGTRPRLGNRCGTPVHQSARDPCRYPRTPKLLAPSTKNARPIDLRLPGNPRRHSKLDLRVPQNKELTPHFAADVRGKRPLTGTPIPPQYIKYLGRPSQPAQRLHRLDSHPHRHLTNPRGAEVRLSSQAYARRETKIPGIKQIYSATGTGGQDPAGSPLPSLDGQKPWRQDMGVTIVTPPVSQVAIALMHLIRAPSDAVIINPDWPAQPWFGPAVHAAYLTRKLSGPTWHRARHTGREPYTEKFDWTGRLFFFHSRPPETSLLKDTTPGSHDLDDPPAAVLRQRF
jgi:hypothetical protein